MANLTGKYETSFESPAGNQKLVFDLIAEDSVLTGTVYVDGDPTQVQNGRINEDGTFKFKANFKTPMGEFKSNFTCEPTEDGIKGVAKVLINKTPFEAKRI